jgi:hypothetical protein
MDCEFSLWSRAVGRLISLCEAARGLGVFGSCAIGGTAELGKQTMSI